MECTPEQAEALFDLTQRMLSVNQSMNLTAITEEIAIIFKHYVDSLMISAHIPPNTSVIDVGCGAGFPSLPLAIFRPDLRIVALDGTAKRIRYVEETASILGLENLTAISGRAEEYGIKAEFREQFDIVTARAVANLRVLCELCLPFAKVGGAMISMKSAQAEEELTEAKSCITQCGGKTRKLLPCDLKFSNDSSESRNLIIIDKKAATPKNFPRHFSKISKKPL
ncbi:MAG: 16S rRNA (guanine(527)-N(7))-methyltransferase RsmG [Clostridia bacterium]|nr:16S rRNA (guanine(527)-N(7))-methyltransferase RsmG [Clostridia bacterium]